jgi:hypothetical protein
MIGRNRAPGSHHRPSHFNANLIPVNSGAFALSAVGPISASAERKPSSVVPLSRFLSVELPTDDDDDDDDDDGNDDDDGRDAATDRAAETNKLVKLRARREKRARCERMREKDIYSAMDVRVCMFRAYMCVYV